MKKWKGHNEIFLKREKISPEKIGRGFTVPINSNGGFYVDGELLDEDTLGINVPNYFKGSCFDEIDGFI